MTAWPLKMKPIICREPSVQHDYSTLRKIPEEHRTHLHGGGSLESRLVIVYYFIPFVFPFPHGTLSLMEYTASRGLRISVFEFPVKTLSTRSQLRSPPRPPPRTSHF
jgi:hypothetical protein